jgi:acyl-CoA synthetase (NDP forming)
VTPIRSLAAAFDPERVAVVGASATEGSPGWVLWRNLANFPGEQIPVSRSAPELDGVRCYGSLREVPGRVDLAIVAVPAAAVPEVIADAAAADVGACVVVSAGFAEVGEQGAALQDKIVRAAREAEMVLIGPNCLGLQNCDVPLNASLSAGTASGGGGISIITQSGSYAMALNALSADEGIGFAVAYSSGNRCDVDDAEVVDHLRTDDRTRVICLFLESLGDGRLFLDVARATTPVKPVIVTAVGRSTAGARAAASHTASLASDRRVWDDVLDGVGVIVAHSGQEMLDAARVLADQPLPRGARAAIITNSGGTGTELSDLLALEGIEVPELSAGPRERLDALLPGYGSSANPVDVTPAWARFVEMYPAILTELARSGEVDIVIPVLLHRSAEDPGVAAAIIDAHTRLRAEGNDTAVYVCWVARRSAWPVAMTLQEAGIPCLEWPARTARAAGHAARYAAFRRTHAGLATPALPEPVDLPIGLEEYAGATEFIAAQGIPVVSTLTAASAGEAVEAARTLGFPVVAKVDAASISHKSDIGGVWIGLSSESEVAAAAADLLALAPDARVVLQPQLTGIELVVGGLRDATFGPVVALGLGGVLVEALDDIAFAAAPLSEAAARALPGRLRGAAVLTGYRGAPGVDLEALAGLIHRVGDLLCRYPGLAEIDLNPVLASPEGIWAVDVRLITGS